MNIVLSVSFSFHFNLILVSVSSYIINDLGFSCINNVFLWVLILWFRFEPKLIFDKKKIMTFE